MISPSRFVFHQGIIFFLCLISPTLLIAAEKVSLSPGAIAMIVAKQGNAFLKKGSASETPLAVGTEIRLDDTIITKTGSKLKVILNDGNVITIGPDSEVLINVFLYQKNEKSSSSFLLKFGAMWLSIQKGMTSSVDVKTPNAIAGVRGTKFYIRFLKQNKQTSLFVKEGAVSFSNDQGEVTVNAGYSSSSAGDNKPNEPTQVEQGEMDQLFEQGEIAFGYDNPGDDFNMDYFVTDNNQESPDTQSMQQAIQQQQATEEQGTPVQQDPQEVFIEESSAQLQNKLKIKPEFKNHEK